MFRSASLRALPLDGICRGFEAWCRERVLNSKSCIHHHRSKPLWLHWSLIQGYPRSWNEALLFLAGITVTSFPTISSRLLCPGKRSPRRGILWPLDDSVTPLTESAVCLVSFDVSDPRQLAPPQSVPWSQLLGRTTRHGFTWPPVLQKASGANEKTGKRSKKKMKSRELKSSLNLGCIAHTDSLETCWCSHSSKLGPSSRCIRNQRDIQRRFRNPSLPESTNNLTTWHQNPCFLNFKRFSYLQS